MTRVRLADAEVYEWIALRRVSGGVARVGGRWVEGDYQGPGDVAGALAGLLAGGLVMLLDPAAGLIARAARTNTGTDRYESCVRGPCGCPPPSSLPCVAGLWMTTPTRSRMRRYLTSVARYV